MILVVLARPQNQGPCMKQVYWGKYSFGKRHDEENDDCENELENGEPCEECEICIRTMYEMRFSPRMSKPDIEDKIKSIVRDHDLKKADKQTIQKARFGPLSLTEPHQLGFLVVAIAFCYVA